MAVKLLVIEAMRKIVSGVTGAFRSTSRRPDTPTCATPSSMTMPQMRPGMCSAAA